MPISEEGKLEKTVKQNPATHTDFLTPRTVTNLLKTVKQAFDSYEVKQEHYYQSLHETHQAEQVLLKLKRRLLHLMRQHGLKEVNLGNLKAQLKQHVKVVIDDYDAIPREFIVVARTIDTVKLEKALHAGKLIIGAHLEHTTLSVKLRNDPSHD